MSGWWSREDTHMWRGLALGWSEGLDSAEVVCDSFRGLHVPAADLLGAFLLKTLWRYRPRATAGGGYRKHQADGISLLLSAASLNKTKGAFLWSINLSHH